MKLLNKNKCAYLKPNGINFKLYKMGAKMESKIEKEVRILKIYAIVATVCCFVIISAGFASQTENQKFEEIDV